MPKFEHYDQGTPSWIELMTPDQAAAQTFYADLFGWSFDDHDMGEMGHYYVPTIDGDEIGGISRPDARHGRTPRVLGRLPRRRRRGRRDREGRARRRARSRPARST